MHYYYYYYYLLILKQEVTGPSNDVMTSLSKLQEENRKKYNLEKSVVSDHFMLMLCYN